MRSGLTAAGHLCGTRLFLRSRIVTDRFFRRAVDAADYCHLLSNPTTAYRCLPTIARFARRLPPLVGGWANQGEFGMLCAGAQKLFLAAAENFPGDGKNGAGAAVPFGDAVETEAGGGQRRGHRAKGGGYQLALLRCSLSRCARLRVEG